MRTAVVVVTHDTCDEVLGCLGSLASSPPDEVVVVDTGSSDDTAAAVRAEHPWVRILELGNVGYGRAANTGIRATTAAVVVVANADVRFAPNTVDALAEAIEGDPGLGAAGPVVTYPDGTPQASARTEPGPATALAHALLGRVAPGNRFTARYRQTDVDPAVARDVDWLSGCALALRRSAVEPIGGFDPGYFLYLEDVDLARRLRGAGWRLRYEPRAAVVHRVGASTSAHRWRALVSHATSLDRYYGRRYGGTPMGILARPLLRVGLVLWVPVTWMLERLVGSRRSTTGERTGSAR